jgi:hypothetical protein
MVTQDSPTEEEEGLTGDYYKMDKIASLRQLFL